MKGPDRPAPPCDGGGSTRSADRARHRQIVDELLVEHAHVSGDAFQIDACHWAIHGIIPVDGDVILAKFDSRNEASAAIEELWEADGR